MDITFTLQAGFSGTQADNFNISGTTSSGTLMSLGTATKAQLTTGHTVNADPTITGGTITSTGVCTTSVNWLTFGNQVPLTSTLSYTFQAGFYDFYLTEALLDDITITIANVNGHTSAGCGSAAEDTATIQSPVTIPAGQITVSHDANVAGWPGITHIKPATQITLLTFGSKTNGDTFNVESGTVVTVSIDSTCQTYAQ